MTECTIVCRICGGVYDLPAGKGHAPCPFCAAENLSPAVTGQALDRLQRATRLRLAGEMEEARRCYEAVLSEYDDDHEALWGKLLCQYGVEFVTEAKTGARHATVHVPRSRPMQLHADFRHACQLAPEAIRAQYEAEAAGVDAALAEIRRRMNDSLPYDVFLCHKTTPLTGEGYTEDYNRGVQLYLALKEAGYRVFFAPFAGLTPGAAYEAGIWHALATSKVMLLVSSDAAYLESPWVKSEWSRFLEMMDDGADKRLIPLMYDRMTEADMPREIALRRLSHIRMEHVGATEALMKTVAQHVKGKALQAAGTEEPCAPESDFVTRPTSGGVCITKYTGPGGEVWIPPTVGGVSVVKLGPCAFLHYDSLTGVHIPQSVTEMEGNPFPACPSLRTLMVSAENRAYHTREQALYTADDTLVSYPAGLDAPHCRIPAGTTRIGDGAFRGCSHLKRISIPEGVTRIGDGAFKGCVNLTSISIPEGVAEIGANAFEGCTSLKSARIPEGETVLADWLFYGCSSLESVHVPESVTEVGWSVFEGCDHLTQVNIPEGVTFIGAGAFSGCARLERLRIPSGVTAIEEDAFADCPQLTLLVREDSVAHRYARENQLPFALEAAGEAPLPAPSEEQQAEAALPADVPSPASPDGSCAPEGDFDTAAVLGGVCITKYNGAGGEVRIPTMIGGRRVVKIGAKAFAGCPGLMGVRIPAGVAEMEGNPFAGCPSLRGLTVAVGNHVYYTREQALLSREGVLVCYPAGLPAQAYKVPAQVTAIGADAFSGSSLQYVTLQEGVTSIGAGAFRSCGELLRVTFPKSLKTIGDAAFAGCPRLAYTLFDRARFGRSVLE